MPLTAFVAAGFFVSSPATAATLTWTGASGGSWFTTGNWSPAQVPTAADDVVIDANAVVAVPAGSPSISFKTLTLGDASAAFAPTLKISAAASTAGLVTVSSGAVFQQDTTAQLNFGGVTVLPGGVLTHTANASSRSALLNLSVSGNFNLQMGAMITVNGLGYAPGAGPQNGFGPGAGTYGGDGSGGGHGGAGGRGSSGAVGGGAYDNTTNPTDLGSGGAGAYSITGGAGGGAALIAVGGTFSLNGMINANGGDGVHSPQDYGSGGGAGGAINITAATMNGTGSISANGGAGAIGGNARGGGGGGGRASIVVTGADTSNLNLQANAGGNGGSGSLSGGAGVIARKGPGASVYSLSIGGPGIAAQSITPITGSSPTFTSVAINNGIVAFDAASTASISVLLTANAVSLTAATLSVNGLVVTSTMSLTVATLAMNGGTLEIAKGATLQLTAQATSGSLQVDGGGTFAQMNAVPLSFASVKVLPGGALTHNVNAGARAAILNLNVSGNFDLQSGATIALNSQGYAPGGGQQNGFGPGAGLYGGDGSGGGHGGAGGRGSSGAVGGGAYDNATNPTDLGSGGAGSYYSTAGGAGGGAALIAVGGTFSLNGVINANGGDGAHSPQDYGSGGGAGGTVNITATAFNGTGSILANGGAGSAGGNNRGGGGGGGRVSIVVTGADGSNLNLQANGGIGGGSGAASGGAGVIALKTSGGTNYNLSIGDLSSAPQSGTAIAGSAPAFSTVTLNNSIVSFDAGSAVTINNLVVAGAVNLTAATLAFNGGTLEVKNGGILRLSAQATVGGNLIVDGGGVFQQMNTATLNFVSVNVLPGGTLTHAANGGSRAAVLNLNVTGDFNLQAGATIAANSQGYSPGGGQQNGFGPGAGLYGGDGSGGGHGGAGGRGSSGAVGGGAYDNATSPTDLGSGGGGSYYSMPGGAGGGAALIAVGGTFSLNGVINANGGDGAHSPQDYGSGGGAGGTVNIRATSFSGTGSILANGGVGSVGGNNRGGGGGGGRISIVVTGTDGSNLNLQANGGIGGGPGATNGGAGVIALKTSGGTNYNLSIGDLSFTPQSGTAIAGSTLAFSTVALYNSIVSFDAGSTVTINNLVLAGAVNLTAATLSLNGLVVTSTLNLTAATLSLNGGTLEVANKGVLNLTATSITGASLKVDGGGTFAQMNAASLSFSAITVLPGGVITHAANSTTRTSLLNLNVSGNFDLRTGAAITLNGMGYAPGVGQQNGFGPGAGIYNGDGSGGGHGGTGGRGSSGAVGGAAYDNTTNPSDLGSGGAGSYYSMPGGAGGGAALITVGGTFSLNGAINANGGDGAHSPQDYGTGGGGGGAVNIVAATMNGTGSILANGGAGGIGGNNRGGGGGGGRIAIVVTGADGSTLTLQANGAASGGPGAANGGAGVIARKGPSASSYSLAIGDPSVTPQSATPLPGASPTFANMTINNAVVTFDAGSTATATSLVVTGTASVTAATLAPAALEVASGAVLQLTAQATNGSLQVDGGGMFVQMNTAPLSFAAVTVLPGGVLTHNAAANTRAAILNLNVSGNFDLRAGAAVALSGAGYAPGVGQQNGFGPGAGIYGGDGSGGGHGGAGGRGSSGAGGGAAYDNAASPSDLGSGGAGSYYGTAGGAGGGAALITVGGAFLLNGTISANGVNGGHSAQDYGSGGGAGGTVNLTAAAFNGSGTISATGGFGGVGGNNRGGGGGGGLVALTGCNANKVTGAVSGGASGGTGAVAGSNGIISPSVPAGCPSAPPAPASLAVASAGEDASGSTFIAAMWSPSAQTLSYTLRASTAADFSGTVYSATSTATTATVRGLTPNAAYFLQVAAYNNIGFSTFSAAVTTRTPADLTPPQPPVLANAAGGPGGRVSLAWRASATGEQTASFNLYRSTGIFASTSGLAPIQLHVAATTFMDTPPADGTYYYGLTALDPSFNESSLSNALSAQSLHAGPPAPSLTAVFSTAQKQIALSWTASTGAVAGYNVYRATYSAPGVAGRAPLLAGTTATAFIDAPSAALDATYYYLVTAVDPVGNEGAPSNQASAIFDVHPPLITIIGVSNGQYTSANLTPVVAIADFSPFVATVTLNGQPFASNTMLSQPGTYFLSVAASDVFADASSATVSFTIDKASPTFVLLSPPNGLITNRDVLVSYQVSDDLTPTAQIVVKDDLGSVVPSSYTIVTEGARNLTLTARDLAGNATSASAAFILDKTPPVVVSDLRLVAKSTATGQATVAWTSPHDALSGVAGYIVKAANYPLTAANFDAAPTVATSTSPRAEGAAEQFVVSVTTPSTVYFAQKSSDAAGNLSAISNVAFWDLDGPALSGLTPAPGVISRPTFLNVSASDLTGVAQVVFFVDHVAVSTVTGAPFRFAWNTLAYADGPHTLTLAALDVLGNASSLSASYMLNYAPPAAPTITSPAATFGTSVATLTVVGIAEPGIAVQARINDFPGPTSAADSLGNFSIPLTLAAEGTSVLTVVASDAKGTSSPSASRTVIYNASAPGAPAALAAAIAPAGHVTLSWQAPAGKIPSSYDVYRSTYELGLSSGLAPNPALRVASQVAALNADDLPPSDGLYFYGVTSLDLSGNESRLSNIAPAAPDRVAPTAALAFLDAGPPLGPGSHQIRLTLNKTLASAPLLTFTPSGQAPTTVNLAPITSTVWSGTLTVTSVMASGTGQFRFQGADFAGNVGQTLTAGGAAAVDTSGPAATIRLNPASPVKAGAVGLTLNLDKPAVAVPTLTYVTTAGSTVPVTLIGTTTTWTATLTISTGSDGTAAFAYAASDVLGNLGTLIASGGSFVIQTTAPGAPQSLRAAAGKAGLISLTWSRPISGTPAYYLVTRDGVQLTARVAPNGDGSGAFSETPADGAHAYKVVAVDAAGNVSPFSNVANQIARSVPPPAPAALTIRFNTFGSIQLDWQAGSAEFPASYNVYRTTYPLAAPAGGAIIVSTPPFVEAPSVDAFYYYLVTEVDFAGNESTTGAAGSILWDKAPPVIAFAGVQEGGLYNFIVHPSFTATDPALATGTVVGTLNGLSFASGTPVSADGDYALTVSASNQAGQASTKTVHFTIDMTPPVIAIAGIITGQTYHVAVLPIVTVSDPHLTSVVQQLDASAYTSGVPISDNGAHVFTVTARDGAGNVAVSSAAFTLALPPVAPPSFALNILDGVGAQLSWLSPGGTVAGYRVYKDGAPITQGLLTTTQLSDPSFAFDGAHTYEVSAVDAIGQEGARASIPVARLTLDLSAYGVPDSAGNQALTRGFFDAPQLRLGNASAQVQLLGPATLEVLAAGVTVSTGLAPAASVPAGGAAVASGAVAVPAALPDAANLRVTLTLPSPPGTSARWTKTFPVAARSPREPIVEVFTQPLVLGTNAKVQVKFNNQGSAPLEIRSAPSSDLDVQLLTPQGTLLSDARLNQTGNGAQVGPGTYFMPVAPNSSALFDAVSVFVPNALGASGVLTVSIPQTFSGLLSGSPISGTRQFSATKTLSGVASPSYSVSVAPAQALYDQGSTVALTGVATSSGGFAVAGATVTVGISLRGFERTASALTDATGNYSVSFAPTPSEAGLYTLWASAPDVVSKIPQSSFTIEGFAYQYANFSATLVQNSASPFTVNLLNTGQNRITGIAAQVSGGAAGVSLTLDPASVPAALDPGQSTPLSFNAGASSAAALGVVNFTVAIRESHGFARTLPVAVTVGASAPSPSASPSLFNIGVVAGQTRALSVTLTNNGTRAWTGVNATAPGLAWVTLQSNPNIGDVAPGQSTTLSLLVAPPPSLPTQAYAANPLVTVLSSNASAVPINALITVTASGQGNAVYNVINADKPRDSFGAGVGLAGAQATLTSLDVAGLNFTANGDANGVVQFTNVPAGRYNRAVKAAGFQDAAGVETIEPGLTKTAEIVMLTNVVSYNWTVTPTTIVDNYTISLAIDFKTDVPAPVVVMSPAVFNFVLGDGQSTDAQLTVTNKGLVAADNVQLLPNITDPAISIDMPYSTIPRLAAGQTVVVPFHLTLAHASCHTASVGAKHQYTCAAGIVVTRTVPATTISAGSCGGVPTTSVGSTSSSSTGGGGFGGGGGGSSQVSVSAPASYISAIIPNPPAPTATPNSCQAPTDKQPSRCQSCDAVTQNSDPGGDPRIPESDLSLNVPIFGGSLDFMRYYDSGDLDSVSMGPGWMHGFESRLYLRKAATMFIPTGNQFASFYGGNGTANGGTGVLNISTTSAAQTITVSPETVAEFRTPSGTRLNYTQNADGSFRTPTGETAVLAALGSSVTPTGYTWTLLDKTVYAYDAAGKLQTITDRNRNVVTLQYSGGRLGSVTDPNGRTLYTFAYNGDGTLRQVTDLAGRTVAYTYSSSLAQAPGYVPDNTPSAMRLVSATGPKGTTGYGYTAYSVPGLGSFANGMLSGTGTVGLLTTVTSPNGFTTAFTYGPPAHVVSHPPPSSNATWVDAGSASTGSLVNVGGAGVLPGASDVPTNKGYYTPLLASGAGYAIDTRTFFQWYMPQRFLTLSENGPLGLWTFEHTVDPQLETGTTKVTDPRGFVQTHTWKTINGQTVTGDVVDAGGGDARTTYDAQNNPSQVTDRAGRVTSYIYNAANQPTQVTDALSNKTNFTYEPNFHQLSSVLDPKGNSTQFSYDAGGNLTRIQDAQNNSVQIGYDAHGLATSLTDPLNKTTQLGRDANGYLTSITDPINRSAALGYDAQGRMTSVTDAMAKTTQFAYDADDDLTQVRDALGGITHYNYTPGLNSGSMQLTSVQDALNHSSQFAYDARGRLLSATNPANQTRSHVYDQADNLTQVTKPDGTVIAFAYDNLGRMTSKNVPGDPVAYSYDAAGHVIGLENNESKLQVAYDADDRPVQVIQTNKAASLTSEVDYQYDANGNRTRTTLQASPTPFVWNYTYDSLNRLTSIVNPQNKTFTFAYDALGRRTQLLYPNGVRAVYTYDNADQITGITYTNTTGVVVSSALYTYDGGGNPAGMTDAAGTHQYAYDDDHRLTSAAHPAASTLPTKTESFSYDLAGNRLADANANGYAYDAANRLQQNSLYTYAYDANGNRTSQTSRSTGAQTLYVWDKLDLLTHIARPDGKTLDFKYDPRGRLIEETVSSTTVSVWRFIYAGPDIIAVADGANNLATLITHGPGNTEPLSLDSTASSYYLHADKIGSVKALTDSGGVVIERTEYAAYGAPTFSDPAGNTYSTSQKGNFYADTGAEWVGDAGLSRHGLRFLDVQAGSFISEEAYGFDGPNRYLYAADRPTKYVDRTGAAFVFDDVAVATIILPPLIDWVINAAIALWVYEHLRPAISKAEEKKPEEKNPPAPAPKKCDEPNEAPGQDSPYGTTPKGRPFTKHYGTETGPKRKIPGSVVDDVIENPNIKPVRAPNGTNVRYDPNNDVTVVTGKNGVVSVRKGPPRKDQR